MKTSGNKPIGHMKVNDVSVSVWENEGENGKSFYSFSFQRSYNAGTKEKPEWKNVQSYTIGDLWKILSLSVALMTKYGVKEKE